MRLSGTSLLLALAGLLIISSVHCQDEVNEEMDFDEDVGVEDDVEDAEEPKTEEKPKLVYKQPKAKGNTFFVETFESDKDFTKRWVVSEARKDDTDADIAKYDGKWSVEEPADNPLIGDKGLVLKSKAKHHAIAVPLDTSFDFKGKPFVVQYEVKFQNGQECGGAYMKLLSKEGKVSLRNFFDKTPYTIMFGPDKCGNDAKLHFIFRHKNPVSGKVEEKHAKKPKGTIDTFFTDKRTHLFTLVITPSNTFEIYVDQNLVNSGSLLTDFTPPVTPEKEIVDPEDRKPEDWDEREKIADPEAVKPADWDEDAPEYIPDPDATKPAGWLDDEPELTPDPDSEMPSDWEEDMDGEWEPPMISNPACEEAPGCGEWSAPNVKNPEYKGKWKAPLIDNPNYKGKWHPRKIDNPDYFEDLEPYKMTPISAVGLELWSMSDDIYFDNFIITDDKKVADEFAADSWELKHSQELSGGSSGRSVVDAVMAATSERPWLWAVILIVIILPIVLVIAYCCMPSGSPKPEDIARADAAKRKKTDAPTPDEKEEDDEDEEEEDEEEEEKDAEKKKKPKEEKADSSGDAPATKKSAAKKSDLEAEVKDNEGDNEAEEEDAAATRSSPRKRKTRTRKD